MSAREITVSIYCMFRCQDPHLLGELGENEACVDTRYVQQALGMLCECECHAARAEREADGWR